MITARRTVLSNFTGSSVKPGAIIVRTMKGIESSITMVRNRSTVKRTPNTSSEKRRAPSMPVLLYFLGKKRHEG